MKRITPRPLHQYVVVNTAGHAARYTAYDEADALTLAVEHGQIKRVENGTVEPTTFFPPEFVKARGSMCIEYSHRARAYVITEVIGKPRTKSTQYIHHRFPDESYVGGDLASGAITFADLIERMKPRQLPEEARAALGWTDDES